jgi:hypothetical protein
MVGDNVTKNQGLDSIDHINKNDMDDLIDSAIEELMFVAVGGQNMKEYTDSVLYIKDVLKKCKSEEVT